ncbi:MAG: X-Pro dipeptidyl-peptidase [Gimesia sp.]|uniref:X-Pro dipeptidyl-peptidase n=1 Tax=Gimesia maris TaxID=122 RepID=A0A3D3RDA6_9PLAN|nr:X-Pro dipeptidyl-peptidase [Gimesia sp.]HCO26586.1 X-Pro dipeptidyl-peptidase [Gimesia maris]|tara:strand:+ start:148370 stop:150097 length:1728 start_codon:yes stop_codon:yes gene_type:complete
MKRAHVLAVCLCLFVTSWLEAAETSAVTQETVMVPMRDGVLLATDVYRDPSLKQAPVLLMRTPYNKDRVKKVAERFADAGYVAVVQDCRGKFQSEGVFYPYDHEGRDGYDAIEWLGKQPWCNGRIGMWGASYVGATQWLAANEQPPGLVTIAPTATFSSFYRNLYLGGAMRLSLITRWAAGNSQKPEGVEVTDDWRRTLLHLPMSEIDDEIGWSIPWLEGMLTHPEHDGYWKPTELTAEIVDLKLPMQHIVGYYDFFSRETVGNFSRMQGWAPDMATRERQQLILGPWDHGSIGRAKVGDVDFGENAVIDKDGENLKWFERYLKTDAANSPAVVVPVRYFSMGDNVWQEAQTWPPQGFTPTAFYLHSEGSANTGAGNGRLDYCPPVTAEPADSFKADPADPAPACPVTEKRPLIAATWAPVDQRPIEKRNDVLVYTSEPYTEPLTFAGNAQAKLYVSADTPDADWVVKLIDVHPDGFAQNLAVGILRGRFRDSESQPTPLEPGKEYEITVDLGPIAAQIGAGHRLRVDICGAYFPLFDRNPNTGEGPFGRGTKIATEKVYHDAVRPSRIILPCRY